MDPQSTPEPLMSNTISYNLSMDPESTPADENSLSSQQEVETIDPVRSDGILRYIEQILMEDDEVEPHAMLQESWELRAKERSLYDALGEKHSCSPQQQSTRSSSLDQDDASNNSNKNSVAIKEFDDDEWMYTVDGRDDKLAAAIANMQLVGLKTTQQQQGREEGEGVGPNKVGSKKKKKKSKVVDLRTLVMDCAKSVSVGDFPAANSLLTHIRQNSSPCGDGLQRLAHYLAQGLEARLAGTGCCQPSDDEMTKGYSDYLRVYRIYSASSLFRKISSFACNETILERSKKATTIHVIDFGILYGFQWPSFIRRVAGRGRAGQAIKLRITGVDFPMVAGIVEDTGCRLASYADQLGLPFEFKAIVREWETIGMEDLQIDKGGGEFVAVVGSVRSVELLTEMFGDGECPRDAVLKLIRQVNPDIFIHGIVNGSHAQPYFLYRFRELMLQYMSFFDMLDTLEPRDKPERMMLERELIGKEILNVIACEGPERVDRPESHRQWHLRHVKAGFVSVPFQTNLMDTMICKVNNFYHKDFSIFLHKHWLMMCWKGRTLYAMSCWQSKNEINVS